MKIWSCSIAPVTIKKIKIRSASLEVGASSILSYISNKLTDASLYSSGSSSCAATPLQHGSTCSARMTAETSLPIVPDPKSTACTSNKNRHRRDSNPELSVNQ